MPGYQVARIDELERLPAFGEESVWHPVRQHFGITAFGVNAYSADGPGRRVIEEHDELGGGGAGGHQELYVVLSGRVEFTVDGDEFEAGPGTLVFLGDPGATRGAVALEPGTTVLAVGAEPGKPYVVSAWEYAFLGLAKGGREGEEIFAEGIARYPERASLPYNLACMYAMNGDVDAAIDALRQAITINREARDWARDDDDLASLRGVEDFDAIVGAD